MQRLLPSRAVLQSLGLIVALVLLIGIVGLVIFGQSRPTPVVNQTAARAPAAVRPTKLAIPEWGINLPLAPSIQNAVYQINQADSNRLTLSLKQYSATDCAAAKTGLGQYWRYMAGDIDSRTAHTFVSEYPATQPVGSYYYIYVPPSAACSLAAVTTNSLASDFVEAIAHADDQ